MDQLGLVQAIDGLGQGVEHEVGTHGVAHAPADDAAGEYVDDEGHIQLALPGVKSDNQS